MSSQRFEPLLFITAIACFGLGVIVAGLPLPREAVIAVGAGLLIVGVGAIAWFVRRTLGAAKRLVEGVELLRVGNLDHRIEADGLPVLSAALNDYATETQRKLALNDDIIHAANAAVEQEKQRLTQLLAQIAEGVIVCNADGRILLYNERAQQLLANPKTSHSQVGLNRSLDDVFDHHIADHILTETAQPDRSTPISLIATPEQRVVRVRAAAVRNGIGAVQGSILTLSDVARASAVADEQRALYDQLQGALRSSLGGIRAAIETLDDFPDMPQADSAALRTVIVEESARLSEQLATVETAAARIRADHRNADDLPVRDLLAAVQRAVPIAEIGACEAFWLHVDGFATIRMLTEAVERLGDCRLGAVQHRQWGAVELGAQESNRVAEVARELERFATRYGGTAWVADGVIRLLLPLANEPEERVAARFGRIPALYDFDLFDPVTGEQGEQPLHRLTYTVFDTETTGLDPTVDEIVQIAGIRIVNNHLLLTESYEQLVNPQRAIPATATAFHGITIDDVRGAPLIGEVLGEFARFSAETVLVGHNIAFDLRMLAVKETATGICFDQPALDTLLLASILYPDRNDYSLEALAALFNLPVTDRHTATGDTLLTAQIFLNLIPLLASRGIHTLDEALAASQKSYLASLKY